MDKIKIMTEDETSFFEIPWEWLTQGDSTSQLNDLEAKAERGKNTGYLVRIRQAEIPGVELSILKKLKHSEVYPLLSIIRKQKIKIRYFEKYENAFVTKDFYAKKPDMPYWKIPKDNNTDNIIYMPFKIIFTGYGDINS